MNLILVGTNHKFSPIQIRERISFSKKRLREAIFFLKDNYNLNEAIIISTCNRVEIYASAFDEYRGIKELEDFISIYHEIDKKVISPYLYKYSGIEMIRHLFLVTAGLDSLILGETQILGQVKDSFLEAEDSGFVDGYLKEIFYNAISFAKDIQKNTNIGEGKVSVGSVAIDFIKEKIGSLRDKKVLIIGVGKVTELVLKYLKKEEPYVVFISNRTYKRAKDLANKIGAKVVRFDNLKDFLKDADVVISATASRHFIIKVETLKDVVNGKLFIIDLALPRDVDPKVKMLKGVDLFCLEDLDTVIQKNIKKKQKEAERIKDFIDIEVERLCKRLTESELEKALLP